MSCDPDNPKQRPDLYFRKLCLHGLGVELACSALPLIAELHRLLHPFAVADLPGRFATRGAIRPFVQGDVLKHLSSSARRMPLLDPWLELYQDGEQFWLIDERWGMAQINTLRGQWRSWILRQACLDPLRLVEGAAIWPMAQLLRARGLHLIPAPSIVRDDLGVVLLSTFSVGPELTCLAQAGFQIVGQRWTAIRCEDGRIELLHMPGAVEYPAPPRLPGVRGAPSGTWPQWVDLAGQFPQSSRHHAFCHVVLIADAARRTDAHAAELSVSQAQELLRQAWPIVDIHPTGRSPQLPGRMAQISRCVQIQLSRNPRDLIALLDCIRDTVPKAAPRVTVFIRNMRRPVPCPAA